MQLYVKNKTNNQKMSRRPKRYFSKEDIQMAKRCMKSKRSTTLISGEMQIKTTMRYQLTSVRTAIIKKPTNKKWWRGSGEEGSLLHSSTLENSRRFLKKLRTELS